jgi:hypothetical protein
MMKQRSDSVKILSRTEEIDLAVKYDGGHLQRDACITFRPSIFPDYLCRRFAAEWGLR